MDRGFDPRFADRTAPPEHEACHDERNSSPLRKAPVARRIPVARPKRSAGRGVPPHRGRQLKSAAPNPTHRPTHFDSVIESATPAIAWHAPSPRGTPESPWHALSAAQGVECRTTIQSQAKRDERPLGQ